MRTRAYLFVPALLPVLLSVSVVLSGIDISKVYNAAVCASIVTAIPGITAVNGTDSAVSEVYPESGFDGLFGNDVPTTETETVTAVKEYVTGSVETVTVGNIKKTTLSPYSAAVSSNNIYMSNNTGQKINISGLLSESLGFNVTKSDEPQILIYHTHTTESYMENEEAYAEGKGEPRTLDPDKNVVAIGNVIASELEKAGYTVIHDSTVHDHPGFTGCYSRSAETVKEYLKEYPTIKIAIDVHRDSIGGDGSNRVAPVVTVDGKEAAQVMLVMGSETGSVTGYPNWKENLKLALKLQNVFESRYPSFARSVLLRSAKYNQNLTTGSILIEVGSDANTFGQAMYSGELVGKSIAELLDSQ